MSQENQHTLYTWTQQLRVFDHSAYEKVLQQVQQNPAFPLTYKLLDTLYDYALAEVKQ